MSESVASVAAATLLSESSGVIFGVPGGGPLLDVVGEFIHAGGRYVLAHNETSACVMASIHGQLLQRVGLCCVGRGPGVTASTNGIAQATLDGRALLVLGDCVPSTDRSRIAHQYLSQIHVMSPIAKAVGTLGAKGTVSTVVDAASLARRPRAGAVYLDYDPSDTDG